MEISEFAEVLLFGTNLKDKLFSAGPLTDEKPKIPLRGDVWPGRSTDLSFDKVSKKFPALQEFEKDSVRAEALHFFANHELLAIETMAYTLLIFPDTPSAFRNGLVGTIKDEQKHLRLYIERMNQLGCNFGDHPLNDFFWKSMQSMSRPIDYSARMSLLFEQANLDFSSFYQDVFQKIGDSQTADVLQTVYEDEIRHVQQGLQWFDRWRPESSDRWSFFAELLPFPLTPQRAKGSPKFDRIARIRAGFDDSFISRLESFSSSKGRVPHLYLFHPDCEDEAAKKNYRRPPNTTHFAEDLAFIPAFSALSSDAILVKEKPSAQFLTRMQNLGIQFPETITLTEFKKSKKRRFNEFRPWGWGPVNRRWKEQNQDRFLSPHSPPSDLFLAKTWSARLMTKYSINHPDDFLINVDDCGVIVDNLSDAISAVKSILAHHDEAVIKSPFGSSGRGFLKLTSVELNENRQNRLQKILNTQKSLVVEPWLKKLFDYSLQITVDTAGQAKIHGQARFLTDSKGAYRGALLGGFTTGLTLEEKKFLNDSGKDSHRMQRHFQDLASFVAKECHEAGYHGPVGIDALVFRDKDSIKLKPIVETNCRLNMGRIIVDFERKLKRKGFGLWRIFHVNELNKLGFATLEDFHNHAAGLEDIEVFQMTEPVHGKVAAFLFWSDQFAALEKTCRQLGIWVE